MKKNCVSLLLLGLCAVASVAVADDLPKRRPGLWDVRIEGGSGAAAHSIKQCVDEATDTKMMQMGQDFGGGMKDACSKNELTKTATGFASSTECDLGGSKMSSKGTFTGDFKSSYRGEVVTTFDPPFMGQDTQKIEIRGTYEGSCPAAMKPGDMVMNNGMKMNVDDLSRQAKQASEMMKSAGMKNAAQMLNNPELQRAIQQGGGQLDASQREAMKKALEQMGSMQGQK